MASDGQVSTKSAISEDTINVICTKAMHVCLVAVFYDNTSLAPISLEIGMSSISGATKPKVQAFL